METLLIAGIDSVAGWNIANTLSDRYHIIGLSFITPIQFNGEKTNLCPTTSETAVTNCVQKSGADWILYCGPTACSSWEVDTKKLRQSSLVTDARRWASAAAAFNCRFTAISSDAIFTAPWMFHTESSLCFCTSNEAQNILKMEAAITDACPQAVVVRSHVFGWTPEGLPTQSIDRVIEKLEAGENFPAVPFASPILAEQLADILVRIEGRGLTGLFHVASAERCSPQQFAVRVAREFGLCEPELESIGRMSARPSGFGAGESSLQCNKLRKLLGIGFPLVSDGIRQLAIQQEKMSVLYPGFTSGTVFSQTKAA